MGESEIDFCTDFRAEGAKVSLRAKGANGNMFGPIPYTPDHPPFSKPLYF